jgi:hypothetical protein
VDKFRENEEFTKERLDRGVANYGWRNLFLYAEISIAESSGGEIERFLNLIGYFQIVIVYMSLL